MKELYTHNDSTEDPPVLLDENFPKAVLGWLQNGQDLEDLEAQSPITTSPPIPSVSNPHASQSPVAVDGAKGTSAPNLEFTPNPKNPGGRLQKPSPIRPKRTYKSVLLLPPALRSHQIKDQPTSPIQFRRYGKRPPQPTSEPPSSPPPIQVSSLQLEKKLHQAASKSVRKPPKAASVDDEEAQFLEDLARLSGNFDTWDDPQYQLRIEEANIVADMITQMSKALDLGTVAIADQGDIVKFMIEKAQKTNEASPEGILVS